MTDNILVNTIKLQIKHNYILLIKIETQLLIYNI